MALIKRRHHAATLADGAYDGADNVDVLHRLPSTQEQVVALSEVRQDILCLVTNAPHSPSPHRRARTSPAERGHTLYRAVLVASSVNFSLKAAAEQEALLAGYRAFLNGLGFPVQLLIRVRPLDLDPYLARLAAPALFPAPAHARDTGRDSAEDTGDGGDRGDGDRPAALRVEQAPAVGTQPEPRATLRRLAADHAAFVRHLAQRHTLLERHFYVVIPAEVTLHAGAATGPSTTDAASSGSDLFMRRVFRGVLPGARRARETAEARARFDAVAQRLDLRAGEVVRHLARFGVEARRLEGDQLVALYYRCLSPQTAMLHPLPGSVSAAVLPPVQCSGLPSPRDSTGGTGASNAAHGADTADSAQAQPAREPVMPSQPDTDTPRLVGAPQRRPAERPGRPEGRK